VLLRILLFAMLVLGVAGVGGVGWVALSGPPAKVAPPPVRLAVLVAAGTLRAGTLIKPSDLQVQEMTPADAPEGASPDTPAARGSLIGAMVRRSLLPGQPVLPGDVVRPGDHGFLAAVLGPGMRAVTVAVDAVSGTAGLIWPGDRVDVVMTQTLDDPSVGAGHRIAAETVLSDARVIAIDQQLGQGQAPDGAAPPANRTATLEVTATQVERVLVAARLGHLSLSVLSAERAAGPAAPTTGTAASGTGVTWASDVSPMLDHAQAKAPPAMMHVFQGNADSQEFHF
jgi:pilus assembly protein CpaB